MWRVVVVLALLINSLPLAAQPDTQDPRDFSDPVIRSDGRILRLDIPADVPNPERWRFIPNERMPEGNVIDRLLITTFISPSLVSVSDIGLGGGIGLTDFDFGNHRRRELLNLWVGYTSEGQRRVNLGWRRSSGHREVEGRGVLLEERNHITFRVGHLKTPTRRFFGLGASTGEDDETSYSETVRSISLQLQRTWPDLGADWVWSIGAEVSRRELGLGSVEGVENTASTHPELFQSADDHEALWLRASLVHDTRDSQHLPYHGLAIGIALKAAAWSHSRNPGAIVRFLADQIWTVPPIFHDGGDPNEEHPPTDSIAVSFHLDDTLGELPFWALPTLGGASTLRGFISNRWTGESAANAAVEYRPWLLPRGFPIPFFSRSRVERFGLALFAEVGTVADSISGLTDSQLHTTAGIGLRFTFERQALFRADLGFSVEGRQLIIAYGLSF